MAKRKSRRSIGFLVAAIGAIIGLCALIGLALNGLNLVTESDIIGASKVTEVAKLSELVFGNADKGFELSGGLVAGMALVILGGLLGLTGKVNKYLPALGGLLLVVGGVLFFCIVPILGISEGLDGGQLLKAYYTPGTGAILAGTLGCAGGAVEILSALLK